MTTRGHLSVLSAPAPSLIPATTGLGTEGLASGILTHISGKAKDDCGCSQVGECQGRGGGGEHEKEQDGAGRGRNDEVSKDKSQGT